MKLKKLWEYFCNCINSLPLSPCILNTGKIMKNNHIPLFHSPQIHFYRVCNPSEWGSLVNETNYDLLFLFGVETVEFWRVHSSHPSVAEAVKFEPHLVFWVVSIEFYMYSNTNICLPYEFMCLVSYALLPNSNSMHLKYVIALFIFDYVWHLKHVFSDGMASRCLKWGFIVINSILCPRASICISLYFYMIHRSRVMLFSNRFY